MPFISLDPASAQAAPSVTFGAPLTSVGATLADFETELALMLGSRSDITTARLDKWINDAYIDLATSIELPELRASYSQPSVAAQPLYLLPAGVRSVNEGSIINTVDYPSSGGYPLEKASLDWYRTQDLLSGQPQAFFQYGQMVVLYPTPENAKTFSLDVSIRPTKLTASTNSPILPPEWHEAILLLARAIGHSRLLEPELAAIADNDFVKYVRRRIDAIAEQDTGRVPLSAVPRSRSQLDRPVRNLRELRRFNPDLD